MMQGNVEFTSRQSVITSFTAILNAFSIVYIYATSLAPTTRENLKRENVLEYYQFVVSTE